MSATYLAALQAFDAESFARRHGGYKESRNRHSHEYLLPCPHCGSDRLRWNHPTKAAWICWSCKRSGDTVDLIAACEKTNRIEAIRVLEENYVGGDAPTRLEAVKDERPAAVRQIQWPAEAELIDERNPAHAAALLYLARRGISSQTAAKYRIGIGRSGRLKDYLIFPVFMDGLLAYWQGRATWDPPAHFFPEQRKGFVAEAEIKRRIRNRMAVM